jgi:hypothetical protein
VSLPDHKWHAEAVVRTNPEEIKLLILSFSIPTSPSPPLPSPSSTSNFSDAASTPGLVGRIEEVPIQDVPNGTYELVGPKINGNPYHIPSDVSHFLIRHGTVRFAATEPHTPPYQSLENLLTWFETSETGRVEGIVWHAEDGRMVKITRHHLGLPWPMEQPFFPTITNLNDYIKQNDQGNNEVVAAKEQSMEETQ